MTDTNLTWDDCKKEAEQRLLMAQLKPTLIPEDVIGFRHEKQPNGESKLVPIAAPEALPVDPKVQAEVDAINNAQMLKNEQAELDRVTLQSFRHLAPSKRRAAIEDFAWPTYEALTDKHTEACDQLEEARADFDRNKQAEAIAYAMRHPKIKMYSCNGMTDFNNRMKNGVFVENGYHIFNISQPLQGEIFIRVICFPEGVQSYADFAKTPEAIKHGEQAAQSIIDKAEKHLKAVQVEKVNFAKALKAELDLVPDLNKMLKV